VSNLHKNMQIFLLLLCSILSVGFGSYKYLQFQLSSTDFNNQNIDILKYPSLVESETLKIIAYKELEKSYEKGLSQKNIDLYINRSFSLLKKSIVKTPYSPIIWSTLGNLEGMVKGHNESVLEYIIMSLKTSTYSSDLTTYNLQTALTLVEHFSSEQKEEIEKTICNSWVHNQTKFKKTFSLANDKKYICLSLKKYCKYENKHDVDKYCGTI